MLRKNEMSHPAPHASLKVTWFSCYGDKDVKLKSKLGEDALLLWGFWFESMKTSGSASKQNLHDALITQTDLLLRNAH